MSERIELEFSFAGIERAYSKIKKSNQKLDLYLPSLKSELIAIEPFLLQFLNTWVRNTSPTSNVYSLITNNSESMLAFIQKAFGYSSVLMMVKQGRKFYSKEGVNIIDVLSRLAVEELRLLSAYPENRGKKIFQVKRSSINVFCFDHSWVEEFKYNSWFYNQNVFIDEKHGFGNFYSAAVEAMLFNEPDVLRAQLSNSNLTKGVVAILKELVENTDEHAINGYGENANVPNNPNIRGVMLTYHKGDFEYFKNKVSPGDPFDMYLSNPALFPNRKQVKIFLEISVIDSGAGYVQRSTGKSLASLTRRLEKDYLIDCLIAFKKNLKYQGLKRVGNCLDSQKGFFKLRTGRLSSYINYIVKRYSPTEHDHSEEAYLMDLRLRDWYNDGVKITNLAESSGSLITILYPIETNS